MTRQFRSQPPCNGALQRSLFLAIALCALCVALSPAVHAQTGVEPARIDTTLPAGDCTTAPLRATTHAAPVGALDVVLLIDVTSSMHDEISEVQRSASDIVARIRTLIPDTNFALATLADYQLFGDVGDYPWRLDQSLTADVPTLQQALDRIELKSGGRYDSPESYLRALNETVSLSWRTDARRIVLLFGDSTPHDPDPGSDEQLGTADDLTQDMVLHHLSDAKITVLSIYSQPESQAFYAAVSSQTGGQQFELASAAQIPTAVEQLMRQALGQVGSLTLQPQGSNEDWLSWEPTAFQAVPPQQQRSFSLRICAPQNTAPGKYTLGVSALAHGTSLGTVPITVTVVAQAVPFGLPVWLWPPLLMLLLGLVAWAALRRRTRPRSIRSAPPSARQVGTPGGRLPERPKPSGQDMTHGRSGMPPRRGASPPPPPRDDTPK